MQKADTYQAEGSRKKLTYAAIALLLGGIGSAAYYNETEVVNYPIDNDDLVDMANA